MTDVIGAINEQNTTNPSGRIGREPAPAGTQFTIPVTAVGLLSTPEEFGNIILRASADGSVSWATWSITTRNRAASSSASRHTAAGAGSKPAGAAAANASTSSLSSTRWAANRSRALLRRMT